MKLRMNQLGPLGMSMTLQLLVLVVLGLNCTLISATAVCCSERMLIVDSEMNSEKTGKRWSTSSRYQPRRSWDDEEIRDTFKSKLIGELVYGVAPVMSALQASR